MFHAIFSHWYYGAPFSVIAYLLIGAIYGALEELALRHLDGRLKSEISVKDKILGYGVFPWSMWCIETVFVFAFFEPKPNSPDKMLEKRYKEIRYFVSILWPFFLIMIPIGWMFHLAIHPIVAFIKGVFNLPAAVMRNALALGRWIVAQNKTVTTPMFVPPHERAPDPERVRVAGLRYRVATMESDLDRAKQELLEAEMELETKEPPYRGASAHPAE